MIIVSNKIVKSSVFKKMYEIDSFLERTSTTSCEIITITIWNDYNGTMPDIDL